MFRRIILIISLGVCVSVLSAKQIIPIQTGIPFFFSPNTTLRMAAVGDIIVHKNQFLAARNDTDGSFDFYPQLQLAKPLIEPVDFAIANLETTLPGKDYEFFPRFGTPDNLAVALKKTGFDFLTHANNHVLDYGKDGVLRTLKVVDNLGFLHTGAFANRSEYNEKRIQVIERQGIRFVILNYTYGTNGRPTPKGIVINRIDRKKIADDIWLARQKKVDFIIVSYHFGVQYERLPNQEQKDLVDFTFKEGVDVILGAHPHVVQPYVYKPVTDKYGVRKKRLVAYSLANFISNQRERYRDGGMVLYFNLRKTQLEDGSIEREVEAVSDVPVWVYTAEKNKKHEFHIVALPQYFEKKFPHTLSKWNEFKLKRFYADYRELMHPTAKLLVQRETVAKLENSSSSKKSSTKN
ncbi:MAG: CapA family protein [Gammaproteobacteria bacterium]|nr:CapA family protein [Gammaproteobacteria bacterium]MDH5692584.1 CapA family protein [Gammaproteobacteria bacterium]